jgi:hypothetical protein
LSSIFVLILSLTVSVKFPSLVPIFSARAITISSQTPLILISFAQEFAVKIVDVAKFTASPGLSLDDLKREAGSLLSSD